MREGGRDGGREGGMYSMKLSTCTESSSKACATVINNFIMTFILVLSMHRYPCRIHIQLHGVPSMHLDHDARLVPILGSSLPFQLQTTQSHQQNETCSHHLHCAGAADTSSYWTATSD